MSSPDTRSSRFLIRPQFSPHRLTVLVSAARNPSSWVPPSWVLIVLANVCTEELNVMFHCSAISTLMPCSFDIASTSMTVGCSTSRLRLRYLT